MPESASRSRLPQSTALWAAILAIGVGLKAWLLITSQSMPDGDEAVEGLMALHILNEGAHPIYPYGVNYGAGAGWEAHVAAAIFAVFEPTSMALKSVGLFHYLLTIGLVAAIAGHWRNLQSVDSQGVARPESSMGVARHSKTTPFAEPQGRATHAAIVAAGLYAAAPQTAQWALKTGGGHQVAVVLALAAWYCGLRGWLIAALALAPLAALAHPIVIPFVAMIEVQLIWQALSWRRRGAMVVAAIAIAGGEYWLLRPPLESVWNPAAQTLDPIALLVTVPRLALGLFAPNLNSPDWPGGWQALVAALWLAAVVAAACRKEQPRANVWALLTTLGIVFLVAAPELAPRHLLIASPLSAIVLACATWQQPALRYVPCVLAALGCAVQVAEVFNPCIYGPGSQSRGVVRANFESVMAELKRQDIHYSYCIDPMLQWNIVFASREDVLARWIAPQDRVPKYVAAVDLARRSGEPTAAILPIDSTTPLRFAVVSPPPRGLIEAYFQPAVIEGQE